MLMALVEVLLDDLGPKAIAMPLPGVVVGLLIANAGSYFMLPTNSTWAQPLDVNQEENFATAFLVLLLLACALLLLWQISRLRSTDQFVSYWRSLSLLFVGTVLPIKLLTKKRSTPAQSARDRAQAARAKQRVE